MDELTRSSLLLAIRKADAGAAWREFLDIYSPLIRKFSRMRHLQEADADEIVQRVMTTVLRVISRFEYKRERGGFRGWLYRVTQHEISQYSRETNRAVRGFGGTEGDIPTDQVDSAWVHEFDARVLEVALERVRPQVSDAKWAAFELTWGKKESGKAVAEKLGFAKAGEVYKAAFEIRALLENEVKRVTDDSPLVVFT